MRADLASDEPRFSREAEGVFAEREVPEADAAFAKNLPQRLPLIGKFGSARLMAPMLEAFENRSWKTCMDQEKFLAYFLRVQPATGARLLTEASSSLGGVCYQLVFGGLARRACWLNLGSATRRRCYGNGWRFGRRPDEGRHPSFGGTSSRARVRTIGSAAWGGSWPRACRQRGRG